jgi:hypothetical protein
MHSGLDVVRMARDEGIIADHRGCEYATKILYTTLLTTTYFQLKTRRRKLLRPILFSVKIPVLGLGLCRHSPVTSPCA